jgi:hypothetical protein
MPPAINTVHIVVTLIAFGILVGLGWALAHLAIVWPSSRIAGGAALICLLIVILAWVI